MAEGFFAAGGGRHLLGLQGMHPTRIEPFLDLAESYVLLNRSRQDAARPAARAAR